jgi:hypothetical protein
LGCFSGTFSPSRRHRQRRCRSLDALVVDHPARGRAQQLGDLAVAVPPVPARELDDVGRQPLFIITAPRELALRRAVLAEGRAGAALGDLQLVANVLDAGAPSRGAQ